MTTTTTALLPPIGYRSIKNATVLITGSCGFVGSRLVEICLERGAKRVIGFDILKPSLELNKRFEHAVSKTKGVSELTLINDSLTNESAVMNACTNVDIVFHIAALVGPFHDKSKYYDVNVNGTLNIIKGCQTHKVSKLVFSSSPSTRFTGGNVTGQREEELPIPNKFLALYAETKAKAEIAVKEANDPSNKFYTISVAPHQVYGPYDPLFLPNLLETAGNGRLRIFGTGKNLISVCYVDNYCHGLLCGSDSITEHHGKFYIITDSNEPVLFWDFIDEAIVAMGFTSLSNKFHLPLWLLYSLAYVCNVVGFIINKKLKLNPFNVRMLTIHRYFSIDNAMNDLKYKPLMETKDAWKQTIEWFKINWLPKYLEKNKK